MRYTRIIAAPLLVASASISTQAMAATIIECTSVNCVPVTENVLLNKVTAQAVVSGTTQTSGVGVQFTSAGNLLTTNSGQASITADDGLLENISFMLLGGATFQTASFDFSPLSGKSSLAGTSVVFNYLGGGMSGPYSLKDFGTNVFGVTAEPNEQLSGLTFLFQPTGTGIKDFRQLRFGGLSVSAVPEPGTWALMLLGFGFMGFAMRSKSARITKRLQFA